MVNEQILPNFLVIGAMKSGTTSLRYTLSCHPEVFMVYPNEPRFFHSDQLYNSQGLTYYSSFFEEAKGKKAIGEGSGFYGWEAYNPKTAERIAETIPDVKIIYMVRHPIQRIVSHWAWAISSGRPFGQIEQAINKDRRFIDMSMYWKQINVYKYFFEDKNIKILFLEDLKSNPMKFYQDCFNFLGVDPNWQEDSFMEVKNQTDSRLTDSSLLIRLRTAINIQKIKEILPNQLVDIVKPVFKTNKKVTPNWTSNFRKEVERKIYPDSMQFLEYCNKPKDFWQFEFYS